MIQRDLATAAVSLWMLAACVSGPPTEKKSAWNYLNGEHYQGTDAISGIPTHLTRKVVSTKIEGVANLIGHGVPVPLEHERLTLLRANRQFMATQTDALGKFVFTGEIPDGLYRVRANSSRYEGELDLEVAGYEVTGLVLPVTAR